MPELHKLTSRTVAAAAECRANSLTIASCVKQRGLDKLRAAATVARRSLPPPMLIPHLHHHPQDVVPRLRLHHHFVGEHAAVPADVPQPLHGMAGAVLEPEAGVLRDVEF